jgi:hypothetical protein
MKHTQQCTPGSGIHIRNCSKLPPGVRPGIKSFITVIKKFECPVPHIVTTVIKKIQISGDIRVIGKVRKTQHQNPEFGHTQGDIQKKTCKKVR